jgi:hypothetical protein
MKLSEQYETDQPMDVDFDLSKEITPTLDSATRTNDSQETLHALLRILLLSCMNQTSQWMSMIRRRHLHQEVVVSLQMMN